MTPNKQTQLDSLNMRFTEYRKQLESAYQQTTKDKILTVAEGQYLNSIGAKLQTTKKELNFLEKELELTTTELTEREQKIDNLGWQMTYGGDFRFNAHEKSIHEKYLSRPEMQTILKYETGLPKDLYLEQHISLGEIVLLGAIFGLGYTISKAIKYHF